MLIYTADYIFYYKKEDGSLYKSPDNPCSFTIKSDKMIENNVFKKYIEKKQRCEIEILNIHYVDTDDLLSNYDIIT